jgi:UDP-N-acetylmuramoyl-L-alanyl-D-glutamate--2,6-diaminopimelate ligase
MNARSVSLRAILAEIPLHATMTGQGDVSVTGIALDSRQVRPGDLFVAVRGGTLDGHAFIPQAIANRAIAVAGQQEILNLPVPYVHLEDSRQAATWLAAAFYDWPGRKLTVLGVTGTDGKTTTTSLIYRILLAAGLHAGMISTVNAVIGDEVLDTGFHVTTPDAHDLQRYLARMVEAGLTHVVLETTSHAWAQHRADACEFDIGVVTNITHEHLDQHGSYENYRAAKARLFSSLETTLPKARGNPRLAIINRDDESYEFLERVIKVNKVSYGLGGNADLRAEGVQFSAKGTTFQVVSGDLRIAIRTGLIGRHNVSNCLAAIATCVSGLGIKPSQAAAGIAALEGVPGRMERIDMGQAFAAIVDFAHTPNALKVTLETARALLPAGQKAARIISVFGSAGLRDRAKRRMMAEISAQLADLTVLTAEDPRTESLDSILEDMAKGVEGRGGTEGKSFWRVADRGEAIRFALRLARPGDIVLVCGKGHEQSMCFGDSEYAWDDRVAMRGALAELLGKKGPSIPYLPTRDRSEAEWLH